LNVNHLNLIHYSEKVNRSLKKIDRIFVDPWSRDMNNMDYKVIS